VERIVFSSSAAVYGEPVMMPIEEEAETRPANPYGDTKLAMEKMFKWTAKACGMRYIALRYFNACGAHPEGAIGEDHTPETHLIPLVLQVAMGLRPFMEIYGGDYPTPDGTCVRDYIHVDDLATAHILALNYLEHGGKSDIFNLGSGTGFSNLEVMKAARQVTGMTINSKITQKRPGDPAVLVASSEKAKKVLGWQPQYVELERMIGTAFRWHKSHPAGYQDR
jgi:UDP-glucose 4-epimerase